MRALRNILGIVGLAVLGVTGCEQKQPSPVVQQAPIISNTVNVLTGRIIKVQPSFFSYINRYSYGMASNHEFEYVLVEGEYGELHTLVYPVSQAIIERRAEIKYKKLNQGKISVTDFIDMYINPQCWTDDNFTINADGIIEKNGITYSGGF